MGNLRTLAGSVQWGCQHQDLGPFLRNALDKGKSYVIYSPGLQPMNWQTQKPWLYVAHMSKDENKKDVIAVYLTPGFHGEINLAQYQALQKKGELSFKVIGYVWDESVSVEAHLQNIENQLRYPNALLTVEQQCADNMTMKLEAIDMQGRNRRIEQPQPSIVKPTPQRSHAIVLEPERKQTVVPTPLPPRAPIAERQMQMTRLPQGSPRASLARLASQDPFRSKSIARPEMQASLASISHAKPTVGFSFVPTEGSAIQTSSMPVKSGLRRTASMQTLTDFNEEQDKRSERKIAEFRRRLRINTGEYPEAPTAAPIQVEPISPEEKKIEMPRLELPPAAFRQHSVEVMQIVQHEQPLRMVDQDMHVRVDPSSHVIGAQQSIYSGGTFSEASELQTAQSFEPRLEPARVLVSAQALTSAPTLVSASVLITSPILPEQKQELPLAADDRAKEKKESTKPKKKKATATNTKTIFQKMVSHLPLLESDIEKHMRHQLAQSALLCTPPKKSTQYPSNPIAATSQQEQKASGKVQSQTKVEIDGRSPEDKIADAILATDSTDPIALEKLKKQVEELEQEKFIRELEQQKSPAEIYLQRVRNYYR